LLLKKQYRQFERAVRRKDLGRALSLLRRHPALRRYRGGAEDGVLTLVEYAASHRRWLKPAFKAGLHPDADDDSPAQTYLQQAAASGDLKALRLAIHYGADLERRNDWGETALAYACSWDQLEVVRTLVEAGADVNAIEHDPESGYRCTALDCARNLAIQEYLRSHGAKLLAELEPDASTET
jgi:ankyrin repeat protein